MLIKHEMNGLTDGLLDPLLRVQDFFFSFFLFFFFFFFFLLALEEFETSWARDLLQRASSAFTIAMATLDL